LHPPSPPPCPFFSENFSPFAKELSPPEDPRTTRALYTLSTFVSSNLRKRFFEHTFFYTPFLRVPQKDFLIITGFSFLPSYYVPPVRALYIYYLPRARVFRSRWRFGIPISPSTTSFCFLCLVVLSKTLYRNSTRFLKPLPDSFLAFVI